MRDPGIDHVLRSTAWYFDGPRIGAVTAVFVDEDHCRPRWALVAPGWLVPLCRTLPVVDRRLLVVLPAGAVETSPPTRLDVVELRAGLEDVLYAHYAQSIDRVENPCGPEAGPPTNGPITCRRATGDDEEGARRAHDPGSAPIVTGRGTRSPARNTVSSTR